VDGWVSIELGDRENPNKERLDVFDSGIGPMLGGIALLLMGLSFTLWGYFWRDPVTGEFFAWPGLIISGAVVTVVGFFYWRSMRWP
jgi:hypothetical protein